MPGLYMSCSLCDRRQADGLLSRGSWGHLKHDGAELHACPTCKQDSDWEDRVRASAGGTPPPQTGGFSSSTVPQTASGF